MYPKAFKITGEFAGTLRLALFFAISAVSYANASFEDLGVGARGPAMGNAMVAVADDIYAIHYNPAGLGGLTRPQFTAAYTRNFNGLSDGSSLGTSFVGYAQPLAGGKSGTIAGGYN